MEGRGRWWGRGGEDRDEDARRAKWRGEVRGARGRSDTGVRACACVACARVCVKNGESRRKAKSTGGGSVEEDTKRRRASLARFHARNEDERRL